MTDPIEDRIRQTRLFILDLDGTVYLGNEPIPGAQAFIARLQERGIDYVFLTNNSSVSAAGYCAKLTSLGFPAALKNVFTSGQATGIYCSQKKPGARLYVVGTNALVKELASYGLAITDGREPVDFVVIGYDTELTYDKIRLACDLIDRGAGYIATNPDLVCPMEGKRSLPDCGAICIMIEQAVGKLPYYIGKPRPDMVYYVCKNFKTTPEHTTVIGDRLYTDIAVGKNAGAFTICVLTGESSQKDIEQSTIKPDLTIESIEEMKRYF